MLRQGVLDCKLVKDCIEHYRTLSNFFEHHLAVHFHLQVLSLQDSDEETDEYEEYEVQQKKRKKYDDDERQRVSFA